MTIKTEVTLAPVENNTPSQAVESPQLDETQEQVKDLITEKIVIQPIVQPIQVQGETEPVVFQSYTAEPLLAETITEAEKWAVAIVAQPLIAKGVTVYNDNIPAGVVRPREYVVMSVDDDLGDIDFADNKNDRTESLCTWVIQGQGNTFQNWVVEISNLIMDILRQERTKGKVRDITNRNIGLDETTNLLSRVITTWYRFNN